MFESDRYITLWSIVLLGAISGIGKLLMSDDKLTIRAVFGRAITSSILGLSSAVVWLQYPNADPAIAYGITGLLCSLGTSALESLIHSYMPRRK